VAADDIQTLSSLVSAELPQKTLLSLLSKALSCKSTGAISVLRGYIDEFDEPSELNGRNIIHRMIIGHGRQRTADEESGAVSFLHPAVVPDRSSNLLASLGGDGEHSEDEEEILDFLLSYLTGKQRSVLIATDQHLRTPLHYAAHYGLRRLAAVLLKYLKEWDMLANAMMKDSEGATPIELAVAANHPRTTRMLLDAAPQKLQQDLKKLLPVAAQLGSTDLLKVLLQVGADIDYTDSSLNNETALYIASKFNHVEAVGYLVEHGANPEIAESAYGWTPVFVAAVDGYKEVVETLVAIGSKIDKVDGSGWTAMEHACLRGHLDLLDLLRTSSPDGPSRGFFSSENASSSSVVSADVSHEAVAVKSDKYLKEAGSSDAIKTFGHRYLRDKTMVLLTLGTTDMRRVDNPVHLDRVPYSRAHSTQLDTALSLVVSAQNCTGEATSIDLPIPDYGLSTEPLSFCTDNIENARIYFDIVPTYSANRMKVLGRAVAMLSSLSSMLGPKKRSLHETVTLPIIESETLEVLGTVKFGFLIVTPFDHPNMGIEKSATYWKSLITTRVIGHRGMGKNTTKKSLQLGENTIESFIQAANLGASYVEFDVQLTKDHVPVIYHDFLVSETGIDIPVHSLTLEQFLDLSRPKHKQANPQKTRSVSPDPRPRSQSLFVGHDEYDVMFERIRNTRDYKVKGFKGNYRGHSIQSPFTTLEEAFRTLPKNVGFNIECKYPMLDESEAEDMETYGLELNLWVDTVLKCVYDHADERGIIFSSFHPDLCLMLSLKQPSIPILFLTEGGTSKMADVRASSLQEAIRFARRWNLMGLVSECTPLIECPRLVNAVKASGLVCVTYGVGNNEPKNARLQMKSGVDAVIVDSVLAVRKGLTAEDDLNVDESSGETSSSVSPKMSPAVAIPS
jgi:glycerophosphodiester phosphodiesterase